MLYVTRGYAAPETAEAIERVAALAEKSGNLTQLVFSALSRVLIPLFSGDLPAAGMLADQALELALREGSPSALAMAHAHQSNTRHWNGDLAGAEKYYKAGLRLFDDPGFRQVPGAEARARPDSSAPRFTSSGNAPALWTFGTASHRSYLAAKLHSGHSGLQVVRVVQKIRLNLNRVQWIRPGQTEIAPAFRPYDAKKQPPAAIWQPKSYCILGARPWHLSLASLQVRGVRWR